MFKNKLKVGFIMFSTVLFLGIFFSNSLIRQDEVLAQSSDAVAIREAQLRAELEQIEKDIAIWEKTLSETKSGSASIQKEIDALKAKIEKARLTIRAKNIEIEKITSDINSKTKKIYDLEEKMERGKVSLAQMIKKANEIDSYSIVEIVFLNRGISEIFSDLDEFDSVKKSLKDLFHEIRETKDLTEAEKVALSKKKDQELNTKTAIEAEQRQIQRNEAEKNELLKVNKTKEKTYEEILKERQEKAASIRAALFQLRDSAAIPFGLALDYANVVEKVTGVRAAFVLAILKQESNFGANQGSCLLSNVETGDGNGKNTGAAFEQVMKAPRDTEPFIAITTRLGLDWKMTPVSCPPGAKYYVGRGFGGGMGPSQFIPSTWELFKTRVGKALGVSADKANPWNPEHAFTATGIYLQDLGAASKQYADERNAACRYYSGAACRVGRTPPNVFYGDSVMKIAQDIQENMIDPLKGL